MPIIPMINPAKKYRGPDPEAAMIPHRVKAAWGRWQERSKDQEPIVEIPPTKEWLREHGYKHAAAMKKNPNIHYVGKWKIDFAKKFAENVETGFGDHWIAYKHNREIAWDYPERIPQAVKREIMKYAAGKINPCKNPTSFDDLSIGDTFDFISPSTGNNSFFDTCVKTGNRSYKSFDTEQTYTVGSKNAKVYHVRAKENPKRPVYVGVKGGQSFVFHSDTTPTETSHGDKYTYVIGPFRTMLGAKIMARHGKGNPHLQCVADAERFAAKGVSWLLAQGFNV